MEQLLSVMVKYNLIDWSIYLMGFFSVFLMVDRAKALFIDLPLNSKEFSTLILDHLKNDRIDEALVACSKLEHKPMAKVMKAIIERADQDDEELDRASHRAGTEVSQIIVKRLAYLPMVSNVVTLIGLLGTVAGLVISFQAISFADPTQKQTLLANGISLAMHATATGLMVAIPAMVVYSWLYAKQGRIFSEIDALSQKVIDVLRARPYGMRVQNTAYDTAAVHQARPVPPPPGKSPKAS